MNLLQKGIGRPRDAEKTFAFLYSLTRETVLLLQSTGFSILHKANPTDIP
jgi:hypothetical protein